MEPNQNLIKIRSHVRENVARKRYTEREIGRAKDLAGGIDGGQ